MAFGIALLLGCRSAAESDEGRDSSEFRTDAFTDLFTVGAGLESFALLDMEVKPDDGITRNFTGLLTGYFGRTAGRFKVCPFPDFPSFGVSFDLHVSFNLEVSSSLHRGIDPMELDTRLRSGTSSGTEPASEAPVKPDINGCRETGASLEVDADACTYIVTSAFEDEALAAFLSINVLPLAFVFITLMEPEGPFELAVDSELLKSDASRTCENSVHASFICPEGRTGAGMVATR